ncbi:facilitated trehalose transporter Tret1-2 homolog [Frankliniella occidentalis]|uniref:Facilitated trehalose transporter Tret1-2 homolog n=1 Tax=Frankliniella occidentalis TaxID=133901 RepID=A0A6J1S9E8_FRAOC|nr:facilitated trehalose transporter Tret1-2 homolog [Frankliniella occidentalis]
MASNDVTAILEDDAVQAAGVSTIRITTKDELAAAEAAVESGTVDGPVQSRRWAQYLAATTAALVGMAGGTVLAWTSPALPLLAQADSPIHLTENEASWVGSVMPLGAVLGAPPAGYLAQRLGRKTAVLSLSVHFLLSWALVLTTHSALGLYAARLLAGFALGGVCVACPIYINEVAEDEVRGTCSAMLQVMMNAGMLFSYAVGAAESYVLLAAACAAVPALFLVLFAWMPETPAALLNGAGGEEAATRSLCWLRRWTPGVHSAALEAELVKLRRAQAVAKAETTSGESLFARMRRPSAIRALTVALGLITGQQLSGVCVVVFHAETIFRAVGGSIPPSAATVSVGLVLFATSYITTLAVDRVDRRVLLIVSATFMGLSLATLAAFFQLQAHPSLIDMQPFAWLPVLAIMCAVAAFCLGLGPLPWTVMAELLPMDIVGPAGAVVSSACWTLSFTTTKSYQYLVDYLGMDSTFWLFSGCCGVTVVFVLFLVPETRGKSLQAIQIELTS